MQMSHVSEYGGEASAVEGFPDGGDPLHIASFLYAAPVSHARKMYVGNAPEHAPCGGGVPRSYSERGISRMREPEEAIGKLCGARKM